MQAAQNGSNGNNTPCGRADVEGASPRMVFADLLWRAPACFSIGSFEGEPWEAGALALLARSPQS